MGNTKTKKRIRYVQNYEDFKFILKIARKLTTIVECPHTVKAPLRGFSYLEDNERYISITTMYIQDFEVDGKTIYKCILGNKDCLEKYACTWKFDKTGQNNTSIAPSTVMRLANNVYKPKEEVNTENTLIQVNADNKPIQSAKPILGYNKLYDNTEHQVYVYDLNSAYAAVLTDKIIDTYSARYYDIVGTNEVGFRLDDNLTMVDTGAEADVIFPLIESPYKDFVAKWYNIKKTAPKGSDERTKAKNILTFMVGLFQNHNPYLRAYVIHSCNRKIQKILDNNYSVCCMWNTDAVYSTKPLDLDIGDNIGQFKLEYSGTFRQKGNNYQKVDKNETSYRGVLKMLFDNNWNILTDDLPEYVLPYQWNKETLDIEKNINYWSKLDGKTI